MGAAEPPDQMQDDLAAFGCAEPALLNDNAAAPALYKMWPGCIAVLEVFAGLESQWRYRPDGVLAGIDYPAALIDMRMRGMNQQACKAMWPDLKVMERACLRADQQRAEQCQNSN